MNEENKWNQMVENDLAERPVEALPRNAKDEIRKDNWTI